MEENKKVLIKAWKERDRRYSMNRSMPYNKRVVELLELLEQVVHLQEENKYLKELLHDTNQAVQKLAGILTLTVFSMRTW
jgi:hypothetical protein